MTTKAYEVIKYSYNKHVRPTFDRRLTLTQAHATGASYGITPKATSGNSDEQATPPKCPGYV